ncbi:peptidylprolyl isomerase [Ichthyenterobacterium sp. W332]|uniref:Peptidyl-prolyl cis-trans isomerase n=1 Tax=Microcosmobacter mediterraneus TaxID=3075607 RepID=A0ABU2YGY1_9FLAO|nr:peptidylprolyl isomerase [Ichthyenterobacterium sp. W332]MDT0557401.1 peptidylprolyl isomerase [Ichthyenterobacterium sp. W332]
MSYVRLICFCVLFLACEDKKSSQQIPLKDPDTTVITETKKEKPNKPDREFPKLNSKNAMDFFLEYDKEHKEDKIRITTSMGIIDVQLFETTKFHRSNFIFLTKQGYFDGTQFHRVVKNFIIQGGSTDNPKIGKRRRYIGKYLLPPDTKRGFKHHRGVISMPSSEIENAYKLASPYEFFIVQNPKGAYHLDGKYTAFGKVIRGMDVVDKINNVKTDRSDWPMTNVYITNVEILD